MSRAILVFSALFAFGCGGILCSLCKPGPSPTPTPTPAPVPPTADQCHLQTPPAVCGCYDNPPDGASFEEWEPNWGYVCCTPEGAVRVGSPADCSTEPPPELPQPQCTTFVDRGNVVNLTANACDCYAGLEWIPCDAPPPSECTFPQGIPESDFTQAPNLTNTLGPTVNGIMSNLSNCPVGSDCPLPQYTADEWMNLVNQTLRDAGFCAGRHIDPAPGECEPGQGCTDQLSVTDSGSFCDGPSQQFQVYNFGGQGKVRWSPGAYQGGWSIPASACAQEPPPTDPPEPGACTDPDPRGLPGEFVMKREGNGNRIDSTYRVVDRGYCDAACDSFIGRQRCPVRCEGDPERDGCEEAVVGKQLWWCGGVPIESNENPAQATCGIEVRTCTEDLRTCGELPPR